MCACIRVRVCVRMCGVCVLRSCAQAGARVGGAAARRTAGAAPAPGERGEELRVCDSGRSKGSTLCCFAPPQLRRSPDKFAGKF